MSEAAEDWIKRHKQEYEVRVLDYGSDIAEVYFANSHVSLLGNWNDELAINLETAEDCESLCRLLRITPERHDNENLQTMC